MTTEQTQAYTALFEACKSMFEDWVGIDKEAQDLRIFVTLIRDGNYAEAYKYASRARETFKKGEQLFTNLIAKLDAAVALGEPKPCLVMNKCVKNNYKDPSTCLCRRCAYLKAVIAEEQEDVVFVCDYQSQATKALQNEYTENEIAKAFGVDPDGYCDRYLDRGTDEVADLTLPEEEEESEATPETPTTETEGSVTEEEMEGQQTPTINSTEGEN